MAGLVPAIDVFALIQNEVVDARDERGHDEAPSVRSRAMRYPNSGPTTA